MIRPQLRTFEIVLRAPGMLALHLAIDTVEQPVRVQVWDDEVPAYDMGAVAAQWFSDFLGQPLRLVRFDPAHRRLSSLKWTGGVEAPNQFSDGFPLLVTSEASLDELNGRLAAAGHERVEMARFRPNLVLGGVQAHDEDRLDLLRIATDAGVAQLKPVKPCARCPIPNIDPATAASSPAVGDTLQAYRQDGRAQWGGHLRHERDRGAGRWPAAARGPGGGRGLPLRLSPAPARCKDAGGGKGARRPTR